MINLVLNMLITPGDLIPVQASATTIPWTRRKSQVLNYLHRGPVTFSTLVYDTNVGDISALSTYFNPERVSVKDLNSRFGQYPSSGDNSRDDNVKVGCENVLKPRLLLYPEHNLNHSQVKVQRTLKWVLSHQDKESGNSPMNMMDKLPPAPVDPHGHATRIDQLPPPVELPNEARLSHLEFPELSSPGQCTTFKSRLNPIGKPSRSSSSSPFDMEEDLQMRASTMPNLDSALDSVWGEVSRLGPLSSGWGLMQPTETSW